MSINCPSSIHLRQTASVCMVPQMASAGVKPPKEKCGRKLLKIF